MNNEAANERTTPSSETVEAERADAETPAEADRLPTSDEEATAEREPSLTDEQRRNEEAALRRGVEQKGEGRIS